MTRVSTPEHQAGTDLVPTNGNGYGLTERETEAAEEMIRRATEEGASDQLLEMSRQAAVAQKYAESRGFAADAERVMRLKIKAEAGIGYIDIAEHPELRNRKPLLIGGVITSPATRGWWRTLGLAEMRGVLGPAMDDLAVRDKLCTYGMVVELRKRGVMWADKTPLTARARKLGLGTSALARQAGVSYGLAWAVVSGEPARAIHYVGAVSIAEALGVEVSKLRLMEVDGGRRPDRRRRRLAAQRALQREERRRAAKKFGGKIDPALTLAIRLCETLAAARQQLPEGSEERQHADRAYYKATEAEQEIGLVLGIA